MSTRGLTIVVTAALALSCAVAAGAAARSSVYVTFRLPSGNIGCGYYSDPSVGPAGLRCEISSGLRPAVRKPASCDGDWGQSVSMSMKGPSRRICYSDTVMDPRAPVLAYGKGWARGGFTCRSRTDGLTCTNRSGHGWFLSRNRSRLF